MLPKSEVMTISDSKEPVPKKPRRHTQKSVAKALEVEASASAGSAEGRKMPKPKSFCAASTALTGLMLNQLLRRHQNLVRGTKLGEVLAPLSGHMEELIKLSIEERFGMVKHCRIGKTFTQQLCRVTLAVETLHLRYAVEKALEALHGERKQGQGPRTALARELQDWGWRS